MSRRNQKRTLIPVIVHDSNSSIIASSESMASAMPVPSLSAGSRSSVSDISSTESQMISKKAKPRVNVINILEADSTGNLVASPPASSSETVMYHCLFYILPCDHQSDNIETWKTHVLSHFRGTRLPPTAICQWCPLDFKLSTDPNRTWDAMLTHVAHDHFEQGHTLAASRPNFELMKYMYQSKIITEDQLKAIQLCPSPDSPAYHPSQDPVRASIGSADEPYCSTYSPRREKRLRQQRQGISVV
ncbi:conserved hypothetical protein [Talaromyces stipitatus ATCC 10500]|uniref:Uncharacterized protein n=1 Tax=Talaromyces stipitatus (strain ATCC 10500 / CBS 375.48 / QM 6759 / NRRL 1006) TaxID=441959 RepID=B8MLK5_TALSN|nr:uncharacterized protein TSTA_049760 [Talaromyces stipitatus ATCC 10500]EED15538.1 conserved hypothetical protein [Talaromyces stipitatus ATCC 10500]